MVYEGNDKYIFVSYAHKDSQKVVPIVETLSSNGFRVWYDSGTLRAPNGLNILKST